MPSVVGEKFTISSLQIYHYKSGRFILHLSNKPFASLEIIIWNDHEFSFKRIYMYLIRKTYKCWTLCNKIYQKNNKPPPPQKQTNKKKTAYLWESYSGIKIICMWVQNEAVSPKRWRNILTITKITGWERSVHLTRCPICIAEWSLSKYVR